ncbi:Peroxisomal membrane protein PMP27 [Coemansia sp. RSA 1813]|nr:Peroxisomal membrane protein PMP27 [Coemansia sp. RSA 1646]KAJ1769029.1 Peroxisomal membrane protein PMP27 [Coemansia sp. RSA 1843]KAJ2086657.1 Peroxisomal membrane protein PMP27 [Coemansia sp. RSA 986]KAJ2211446.1 Peroxisomal membrane protein PMP27 [Coemansia sp. RSA 487]KAJ2565276.1 Peroxisomal membrane protein PMP27 [Coemansia sp. RSA 1813]
MSNLVHLVVGTLDNSKAVALYVQYASTLVGRDKACRFGQYLARLLAYLVGRRLATRGKNPTGVSWLASLSKVQSALGTTRKVMRSGKFVDFARLFARALTGTQGPHDEVARTLGAVHKAGMCIFMLADTLGLLHNTMGLVRLRNAPRVARLGQRAWMTALVAQVIAAAYQLHNLRLRQADLARVRRHVMKTDAFGASECAVEEQAVSTQRAAASRLLLQSALDLTIPIKGLGLFDINEGLVALAGTVTSLMGIQDTLAKASAAVSAS